MSEYVPYERKKKKKEKGNLVSEKLNTEDLPQDIQQMVRSPVRQIALLQRVHHHGLTKIVTDPYTIFRSPLETRGFASAGEHAMGLIIQPRPRGLTDNLIRALTNSSTGLNRWGHTALYVRVDGEIRRVIGFDPIKISRDVLFGGDKVPQGILATTGHYNNDFTLFHSNSAHSVEYVLPRDVAVKLLEALPHHGPATNYPKLMQNYVGHPGQYLTANTNRTNLEVGNCISWAMNTINRELGANIFGINDDGENADTAVIDLGEKGNALQGHLTKQFLYLQKKSKKTLVLRFHNGEERSPTYGEMPRSFAVIKGLNHLYMLTSVARFTTPWITSVVPDPLYSMIPTAPYYLQSGPMARAETMSVFIQTFFALADQYLTEDQIWWLQRVGLFVGTAVLIYGGGSAEIVYGAWASVLPYVLEWLAEGTHQVTGL